MKRTNIRHGKWKGRPGSTYDLLVTTKATGPRVNVHRWTDTNCVEVRAIRGNAFRDPANFRQYSNETLDNPTPSELGQAEHRALQALAAGRKGENAGRLARVLRGGAPEIAGPACVVIYGDDMAERIVGPFRSGIEADAWLTHNPQPFVEVLELEKPEQPR